MGLRYLLAILLAELAFGSAVWGQTREAELAHLRTRVAVLERQNGELRTALEPSVAQAASPAAEVSADMAVTASRGGGWFGEWVWVAAVGLLVAFLNRSRPERRAGH
jgi:hypothetical protein